MAYTKIHPIRASVTGAVRYITNPEKTDGKLLISSYQCTPESASFDFHQALAATGKKSPVKAYHLIQSFAPGEIDPERAHEIGDAYAARFLGDKYSYVIATHNDKDHVHNHILFCAADNIEHKKYHDCKASYRQLCQISSKICEEQGLSVIKERTYVAKSYKEWLEDKKGTSWKTALKSDINTCIKQSRTYDEFLSMMRTKGYEIKGESFAPDDLKYIRFKHPGSQRWVSGRASSLGPDFTKERIKERIEATARERAERMKRMTKPRSSLIDTSDPKFEENPGLDKWAERQNLKASAAMYAELNRMGFQSLDELDDRISFLQEQSKTGRSTVVDIEKQLRPMSELIYFGEQYQENKVYQSRYKKSKDPERHFQDHRAQLTMHDGAKAFLERAGIDLATFDLKGLKDTRKELESARTTATSAYKSAESELKKLEKLKKGLETFLGDDTMREVQKTQEQAL
ncbi:MAG: relaxase/mobilization nuclease domain-containing protein [Lachnospiraceae bacterium]|nr:relaxase/mobilization nuclease domain-containing protein [Lachnospiraceae bacterium]